MIFVHSVLMMSSTLAFHCSTWCNSHCQVLSFTPMPIQGQKTHLQVHNYSIKAWRIEHESLLPGRRLQNFVVVRAALSHTLFLSLSRAIILPKALWKFPNHSLSRWCRPSINSNRLPCQCREWCTPLLPTWRKFSNSKLNRCLQRRVPFLPGK